MEQKKATPKVERKKGGFRTMPFIIGDADPFLYHGFSFQQFCLIDKVMY